MTREESEKELYREEVACILKLLLTGKPPLAPTEELIFSWCFDEGYIGYSENQNNTTDATYVVTQKGLDHVQRS